MVSKRGDDDVQFPQFVVLGADQFR